MRAETDSGTEVKFDPKDKPGISNLLTIHSLFSGKGVKDLEEGAQKGEIIAEVHDMLTNTGKETAENDMS